MANTHFGIPLLKLEKKVSILDRPVSRQNWCSQLCVFLKRSCVVVRIPLTVQNHINIHFGGVAAHVGPSKQHLRMLACICGCCLLASACRSACLPACLPACLLAYLSAKYGQPETDTDRKSQRATESFPEPHRASQRISESLREPPW